MRTSGTEPNETAILPGTGEVVERTTMVPSNAGGRFRRHLGAGWRFARHLFGMVVAMIAGMAMLGAAIGALGEPPGYANPLVEYGLMGASMSAPMAGWMRYRGHSWSDGGEMTAAMLVPMLALVLPVELGAVGPVRGASDHSLMMLSHASMLAGMVALMVYRRDRYAPGAHGHHPGTDARALAAFEALAASSRPERTSDPGMVGRATEPPGGERP